MWNPFLTEMERQIDTPKHSKILDDIDDEDEELKPEFDTAQNQQGKHQPGIRKRK